VSVTWNSPERPPLKPQGSGSSVIGWAPPCPPEDNANGITFSVNMVPDVVVVVVYFIQSIIAIQYYSI